MAKYVSCR